MDRRFAYIGAIPQDLDALKPQRNTMVAIGNLASGVLGSNTLVDGLVCTPTTPTSLVVNVGPGEIFTLGTIDRTAFGSLAADNVHQIVKQGILQDTVQLTCPAPAVAGQSVVYLVQVQLLEVDIDTAVIPYFNPASLTNPDAAAWSGPANSGVSQPQTRQQTVTVSLKAGVAAAAGSQITPTPDPGYTGLYAITVTQGQTAIQSTDITTLDTAPFIWLKLPQVPGWVQSGAYAWGVDTSASANSVQVTLDPLPAAITAGFGIRCKIANTNTGASTLTVKRKTLSSLGPYPLVRSTGAAMQAGDVTANQVVDLVFDGTSFRDITGTATSVAVGNLTAQSGELVAVDAAARVSLDYPSGTSATPAAPDLFAFYSQSATRHRVITWANLLGLISSGTGFFKGIAVLQTSQTWVKPAGVGRVLAFATGAGGAGGGSNQGSDGTGGGGGGETGLKYIDLTGVASVAVTIGQGGAGVAGQSGNAGGDTSFGSFAIGKGGGGGQGSDIQNHRRWGGAGGTGGTGDLTMRGGGGGVGDAGGNDQSGEGGNSFWAGGGRAEAPTQIGTAEPGVLGSGGGGAGNNGTGSSRAGARGGDGVVVLLMFS